AGWRDRAAATTGSRSNVVVSAALGRPSSPWSAEQIPDDAVEKMAADVLTGVMERRSTWTRANLLAEAARRTRDIRMATPTDRHAIHDRIVNSAMRQSVSVEAPDVLNLSPA